ncbi:MAG: flp pilus-assembly TadE/G-like family protein [Bifidobacteriaceae bacterium]|jgi:secretion/DNA translocation related TadE-like protein|nr:flp pilus-assembly TadE/G-like family protein [Bifidobacteriaceae bacterium]
MRTGSGLRVNGGPRTSRPTPPGRAAPWEASGQRRSRRRWRTGSRRRRKVCARSRPPDCERGSGTVLAIGLVAALALSLLALATVGAALAAHQQAVTAADLSALAGAQSLIDGQSLEQACQAADQVSRASGAALAQCGRSPPDRLAVTCRKEVDLPMLGRRIASASAVAGPP